MKFHHLGIACADIQATIRFIKTQLPVLSMTEVVYDPLQDCELCLMEVNNHPRIELVCGKPIAKFIETNNTAYHICYEVPDIQESIDQLTQNGSTLIKTATPARLFDNQLVAFLLTPTGMIELLQQHDNSQAGKTRHYQLNVCANFSIDPLVDASEHSPIRNYLQASLTLAPYNQIIQTLIQQNSVFFNHKAGANAVILRLDDWLRHDPQIELLIGAINQYHQVNKLPLLLFIAPSMPARSEEEQRIVAGLSQLSNVFIITSQQLTRYLLLQILDDEQNRLAHIPYSISGYHQWLIALLRYTDALYRKPYKVITVDCDYTLWEGSCAEIKANGVTIHYQHKALQRFLIEQSKQGMLICLCSKNNEEDVLNVFKHNPNMLLQLKHITATRINWNSKAENLVALAIELNLALDSFIFIDDNPAECHSVETQLPQVLSILCNHNQQFSEYLAHIWAFDHIKITETDSIRTQQYQRHAQRKALQHQALSFDDFIRQLDLHIVIKPATPPDFNRIKQLRERTNQFRFNQSFKPNSVSKDFQLLVIFAKDRFGEYGLIGVIHYHLTSDTLVVDDFMLSCQVLGRTIEFEAVKKLAQLADILCLKKIHFLFTASERNQVVHTFLRDLAQQSVNDNLFTFSTDSLKQLSIKDLNNSSPPSTSAIITPTRPQWSNKSLLAIARICSQANQTTQPNPADPNVKPETFITTYWRQALPKQTSIHLNDNFFALGGTSLQAVNITAAINRQYQLNLSLGDFYAAPTIAQLAELATKTLGIAEIHAAPETLLNEKSLTPSQEGIWLHQYAFPQSYEYNMPMVYRLYGKLNRQKFDQCIGLIIMRHPALRTAFIMNEGQPVQKIIDQVKCPLLDYQCQSIAEAEVIITDLTRQVFDLTKPPCMRIGLIELQDTSTLLVLIHHHINFDGYSYAIFNRELAALYAMPAPNLAELPLVPRCQIRPANVKRQQDVMSFWKEKLNHLQALNLTHSMSQITTPASGSYFPLTIAPAQHSALCDLASRHNITLFCVYLSLLGLTLAKHFNCNHFPIGFVNGNRSDHEAQHVIDNFVQLLIFPFHYQSNSQVSSVHWESYHRLLCEILSYTEVNPRQLLGLLPKKNTNLSPQVDVVFVMQEQQCFELSLDNMQVEIYRQTYGMARFNLILELNHDGGNIHGGFYHSNRVDTATMTAVADSFLETIANFTRSEREVKHFQ